MVENARAHCNGYHLYALTMKLPFFPLELPYSFIMPLTPYKTRTLTHMTSSRHSSTAASEKHIPLSKAVREQCPRQKTSIWPGN